jgi:hypothetical protein
MWRPSPPEWRRGKLFSTIIIMNSIQQQAILVRDMIDMIRDYQDNADVLEYIESFASSIARIIESDRAVNWDNIAGICDQRYYSLKQGDPVLLNVVLLGECEQQIQPYLPKTND